MKERLFCLLVIGGCFAFNLKGQSINSKLMEPEVGKPCPEFAFDKIDFYGQKRVTLNDFKGKWLVLDFWDLHCSSCISSFPVVSAEQKKFKDSIQFLMVAGQFEKDERSLYTNYRKNWHLEMPCAFDSNLFKSFNVGLLPHTIIVDPKGIVRVITAKPTASKLTELLDGKSPIFITASFDHGHEDKKRRKYNPFFPFLIQGNGGVDSDFLYRSLLSNWTPGTPLYEQEKMVYSESENNVFHHPGRFELCGTTVSRLYSAAYLGRWGFAMDDSAFYGKLWPKPIFEVQDSTLLKLDVITGKNYYCYSLVIPPSKAKREYMMRIMQNDLKNYFGYDVSIQIRKMPYWKVITTGEAKEKLRSKVNGAELVGTEIKPWSKYSYKNLPMFEFIKIIEFFSGVTNVGSPILDETGINEPIDITVEWFKNDYNSVRKALQKNGLDLVKGEKEMKVLVIQDPHEEAWQKDFLDMAE